MLVVIAALVVGAAMWWQAVDSGEQAALTAGAPVTEALPSPRVPPSSTPRRTGTSPPSATSEAPPGTQLTAVYMAKMGQAVLDDTGAVLFRFERDNPHKARSACLGDCAAVWIPVTTSGTPQVTGIDPALVGTVKRPEGAQQVTLAGWPLYKFANARPGEWTGQGTDHLWFVVKPDGQRNLNCLPAPVQ